MYTDDKIKNLFNNNSDLLNGENKVFMRRYEKLNNGDKIKVLNIVNRSLSRIESNNKQKAAEIECRNKAHFFGEWQKHSWTENVMVWDSGPAGHIPVENVKWERTCMRYNYMRNSR